MLREILNKLPPSAVTKAGPTLYGFKLEPCEDNLALSLLPRPAPFEPGAVFMPMDAVRDLIEFLTVTVDVIEDAKQAV